MISPPGWTGAWRTLLRRRTTIPWWLFQGDRSKAVAQVRAAPGQRVNLSAAGTHDPDGNSVSYRWFVYPEAGTFKGDVRIEEAASPQAWFLAPQVDGAGIAARHTGGVGRRSASPVQLSPNHRHCRGHTGMRSYYVLLLVVCLGGGPVCGAGRGLTDTSASPHVKLRSVDIDAVRWTDGFWAERFDWCRRDRHSEHVAAARRPQYQPRL